MAGKKKKISCPACNNPDDDKMVRCDGRCNKWHHLKCVGLDQQTAELLDTWFCNPCAAILKKNQLPKSLDHTSVLDSQLNFDQEATSSTIRPAAVTQIDEMLDHLEIGERTMKQKGNYTLENNSVASGLSSKRTIKSKLSEQIDRKQKLLERQREVLEKEKEILKAEAELSAMQDRLDGLSSGSEGDTIEELLKVPQFRSKTARDVAGEHAQHAPRQPRVFKSEASANEQARQAPKPPPRVFKTETSKPNVNAHQQAPNAQMPDSNTPRFVPFAEPKALVPTDQWFSRQFMAKDLPIFDGAPEQWPLFISAFEQSTSQCKLQPYENLIRLQRALKGSALEAVKWMLTNPVNVPEIIDTLRFMFGRPEHLYRQQLAQIRAAAKVDDDKPETLIGLMLLTKNLCATFEAAGLQRYLEQPWLVEELVAKLSPLLRNNWAEHVMEDEYDLSIFEIWLTRIGRQTCRVTPSFDLRNTKKPKHDNAKNAEKSKGHARVNTLSVSSACLICEKDCASVAKCKQFVDGSHEQRWEMLKKKGLCRQCLTKHPMKPPYDCKKAVKCDHPDCKGKHHPLMHQEVKSNNSHRVNGQQFQFRYLPVRLFNGNKFVNLVAFFDEGSNGTFLEEATAKKLNLNGPSSELCLKFTGESHRIERDSMKVSVTISGSATPDKKFILNGVQTVKSLSLPKQTLNYSELSEEYSFLKGLPVTSYNEAEPQLLIGLNNWKVGVPSRVKMGDDQGPIAAKCLLGWSIFSGSTTNNLVSVNHCCLADREAMFERDHELHKKMSEFLSIDSLGVMPPVDGTHSHEDRRAIELMKMGTTYDGNRYVVKLLWKHDNIQLPDSRQMALKRLHCLRSRMERDPLFAETMYEQVKGFKDKNYIRELTEADLQTQWKRKWYLALFAVTNPNKPNKHRVVADCAAKVDGVSLNSGLMKGPDIGPSLFGILLRFRRRKVGLTSDITEMFQQVGVDEEDQQVQRFLWIEKDETEPTEYAFTVLTFGATCSPALAKFVRDINADEFETQYPEAAKSIKRSTWMDDQLESVDHSAEAIKLIKDTITVQSKAGFKLRGWKSNSPEVMEFIGSREDCPPQVNLNIGEETATEKVLGLWWRLTNDSFTFLLKYNKGNKDVLSGVRPPTKREMMSILMSLYDPLGLISHYTAYLKVLLQDVWRSKCEWDQMIATGLQERWAKWIEVLPSLENLKIPRCYLKQFDDWDGVKLQIHVFTDASQEICAATVYFRLEFNDEVECILASSKTKVARLRLTSIPRLELNAALMGARLANTVANEIDLPIERIVYWTDSKTVLSWIRSDTKNISGQYVAFRVAEIQDTTEVSQWRYVPSRLNVADDATKWIKPLRVDENDRWFNGPPFLLSPESDWPENISLGHTTDVEIKEANVCHVNQDEDSNFIDYGRFEKWSRAVRVLAWILRAKELFKLSSKRKQGRSTTIEPLSADELACAQNKLIKLVQGEAYPTEIKQLKLVKSGKSHENISKHSAIYDLCPYLDDDDILRAEGRTDAATGVEFKSKRPIVMPRDHRMSELLVKGFHYKYHHQHHETVVNEVRKQYKIGRLRQLLKRIRSHCPTCAYLRAKPITPKMAQLPPARVASGGRPFLRVGIDCMGPFDILVGRRHEKRWILIFVCMASRAIHLEVLHGMDHDHFLMAFRNFTSRRGQPVEVFSDNGTNFVKGERILREEFERICRGSSITLANEGIKWHFNPPAAPHMGGSWERLVQSVKRAYYAMKPSRAPTDPLFASHMCEIENVVNSRPLTYLPLDSDEDAAITPNDLIRLDHSGALPIGDFDNDAKLLKANWMMSQLYANHFWKRWVDEYLPELTRRSKWFEQAIPLQEGDLVLIVDSKAPRNSWERGRIVGVRLSSDGQVRSAVVKTSTGESVRPAVLLAKLDIEPKASPCKQAQLGTGGENVRNNGQQLKQNSNAAAENRVTAKSSEHQTDCQ